MGVKWTKQQQQVIDLRDRNILVSAAAGSGKTAVLVERIITMLTDEEHPVNVDELLIVTFTEAAAGEMKERIRGAIEKALEENPENEHLKRQATLIHNAQITTIHSFCLSVIRDHFHVIDIDPGFRTAEEGEKVTDGSEKAKEQEPEITDDTKKKKKKKELKLNFNIGKKKEGEEGKEEAPQDVLDLLVYAAPIDLVRSYYALAEGCDFNVMAIEVDGNGIFQIMKRQVNEGVEMAVQINRDATLINIMSQDKLLLQRTIPYGASTIVEAVMNEPAFRAPEYDKAFKIIMTQRVLLYNLNAANPQNDLSMQKRIELTQSASSLIGNIYRVIEYYNSRYREEPVKGIIVTGDGAKIAGIHELMANELGIPTRTPSELQGVQFNRQIEVNVNILQYVGCFGAVYSPVNFIPEDIKNKTATRESIKGIAAVFAASILVSIVMIMISMISLGTAKGSYESTAQKERSLQPVQAQYDSLQNDMKRILTYMKMEGITDTNNNKLHAILEQVKETCPKDFVISAVNTTNSGGTISCISTDKKLSSVSALVIRLNLITSIKNVKISSSIVKDEDGVTKKQQYKYTISFDYLSFRESRDSNEIDFFGDELTLGDEEAK